MLSVGYLSARTKGQRTEGTIAKPKNEKPAKNTAGGNAALLKADVSAGVCACV